MHALARPVARFLMCRPQHFAVAYSINPWMDPISWSRRDFALSNESQRQWARLYRTLARLGAKIDLVPAVPGLPDLVFTANAAVVLDGVALLARFRHAERALEEPHYETAFRALARRGRLRSIHTLPDDVVLEGAGDCVWDQNRSLFWMGHGPRSDASAREHVVRTFEADAVSLELVDPRFYHMDTALVPLTGGEIMYFPGAFSAAGRAAIREHVPAHQRIEISPEDAVLFAANAVCIGRTIVLSGCGESLRAELSERGYRVIATPLTSFLRSGGSAFCLTLRLDRRRRAMPANVAADMMPATITTQGAAA